jgi:hypothetical protein
MGPGLRRESGRPMAGMTVLGAVVVDAEQVGGVRIIATTTALRPVV